VLSSPALGAALEAFVGEAEPSSEIVDRCVHVDCGHYMFT
jgi:hypothetical protein